MIRGAVFDVDGTIIDSMPFWYNVGDEYLKTLGIEAEEGLAKVLFSLELNDGAKYLNEHYHLNKSKEEILGGIAKIAEDFYANRVPLKKGIDRLFETFHNANIPMTIATASDMRYLDGAIKRFGLNRYMQKIYTCVDLDTSKRESLIFNKAAESFNCRADEVYVFEDSVQAAKTAKDAGFKIAGVYDAAFGKYQEELKALSDIYITDYEKLDLSMFV
jgi:HAD superfamily hydrolase (TIGR01509 family)